MLRIAIKCMPCCFKAQMKVANAVDEYVETVQPFEGKQLYTDNKTSLVLKDLRRSSEIMDFHAARKNPFSPWDAASNTEAVFYKNAKKTTPPLRVVLAKHILDTKSCSKN